MRIGITCYPTYGGSGIVATELGLELANRGHDVHFITYSNPIRLDPTIPRIHYHEVEVSNYPLFQYPPYCLALASRMADVAQSYQLDLLHVHYAIPHSISALLARQMTAAFQEKARRLPFVTTLHGSDVTLVGVDSSYFNITKFSIEQSDGITAISEDLRRDTVNIFGVKNEIRVIYNFVNCETYKPDPDRQGVEQFAPNGEKLLIHLSNFRPVKRVLDCIRIFAEVRKHANVRLLMAGDGPERGPAEHLAWTLGVKDHVLFLGKQDHVERLIRLAHVILMPSEMESFGLAALEAMACGVTPVATRVGGVPELITDGVDGFLEEVGDIPRLAARAAELVNNPSLHATMAAAARRTASTRFCTDKIIPQYEDYYKQVL
ncbi:MAG TPA: N-acetyl-alpha-D-glucosaminyl L-malate synthase BshA [Bryobacteraceae bacterium]|jgi:N-acetyl-alpha-D-glucosaminyl L-malate synthase BshA|nr:N-acetyl-alpha-D-glucosaminyl L-malate synthase BshA [Bryobacteraceae bacterium]